MFSTTKNVMWDNDSARNLSTLIVTIGAVTCPQQSSHTSITIISTITADCPEVGESIWKRITKGEEISTAKPNQTIQGTVMEIAGPWLEIGGNLLLKSQG